MLAALYMSLHIHMCRFTLDVMAICRASHTFSAIMLALDPFEVCTDRCEKAYVHAGAYVTSR